MPLLFKNGMGMVVTLLIAGTSHVGKSSLAAAVAAGVGCAVRATDSMARHPGRPWPVPPPHVAEFYARMSADSIYQFLLHHHQNMWPLIAGAVAQSQRPCVWEGSALRPEYLAGLVGPDILAICLHAPDDVVRQRIHASCGYEGLGAAHQGLVDAFVERSLRDNRAQVQAARAAEITCADTAGPDAVETLCRDLTARLRARL
ncbi:MAG: hypothetical protein H7317_09720 [Pseudorhodobacter sp.]|nr:hypothetical protein [Pseudorhodobacter sp.]